MPAILDDESTQPSHDGFTELPFPPVTKAHILNCSYHSWWPRYRAITPKSRIIPLPEPFLEYLRADGIILPDDDAPVLETTDDDSGVFSASDELDEDDEDEDVASRWRETHDAIKRIIAELGGKIVPKLNWSAPKDATWINSNSMDCRSPNDIYLLFKSSDFITHDLEHPFDDCVDSPACSMSPSEIPYHLILRKYVQFNPSVEFRCFVRRRHLLGMCQRDLNHFDFLFNMKSKLQSLIQEFFDVRLRDDFPDENFVFDVYVPAPYNKVWLVDVNPWAPRTDPLLFSWMEILTMPDPPATDTLDSPAEEVVRLSIQPSSNGGSDLSHDASHDSNTENLENAFESDEDTDSDDSDIDEDFSWLPELRLIRKDDPEAYSFSTQQYSAHKLPRDVVDASQSGEGLREFAKDWQNILAKRQKDEDIGESSEDD